MPEPEPVLPLDELSATMIVCLGRRFADVGKLRVRLAKVEADGTFGKTMDFETDKHLSRLQCGMVYEMPAKIDDQHWRVVPRSDKPLHLWPDQAKREEWRTQDWAAKLAYDVSRQADHETALASLLVALRPQRKAYWRAASRARTGMEVLVLMALRTPLSLEERGKKG